MSKDLGGVAICDAYSPAIILSFYFINWWLLGVIPLGLVYSVVTGSLLFDLSFGPTAALAALTPASLKLGPAAGRRAVPRPRVRPGRARPRHPATGGGRDILALAVALRPHPAAGAGL